jgi:hypothetical protein
VYVCVSEMRSPLFEHGLLFYSRACEIVHGKEEVTRDEIYNKERQKNDEGTLKSTLRNDLIDVQEILRAKN